MSSSNKSSNTALLVLGGVSVVGVAAACWYLWSQQQNKGGKGDGKQNKEGGKLNGKKSVEKNKDSTSKASGAVDEYEDEAKKAAYEDSIRLAKKLMNGNSYLRAAEKYGEAIDLATQIPSAAKDVLTLYNNRSAMYEKAGELDKSMNDITVVLALDSLHLKARVRRARIFEQQGKGFEALDDYVMAMFIERAKNLPPTTSEKADDVCKQVASRETALLLAAIRDPPANAPPVFTQLPTKSYCRTFFEALPSIYRWREQFKNIDRDELASRWKKLSANPINASNKEEACVAALELAACDFSRNAFSKGFETINTALVVCGEDKESTMEDAGHAGNGDNARCKALSQLWTMKGSEHILMRRDRQALEALKRAVALDPTNLDASLTQAIGHLEMVEVNKAESIYNACQSVNKLLQNPSKNNGGKGSASSSRTSSSGMSTTVREAWVLVHRAAMWIAREDNGNFRPDAINKAMVDIDASLALTASASALASADAKAIRTVALLKTVTILSQIKAQTGIAPTSEDQERIKSCVLEAKKLCPDHEAVLMLEADMMSVEGQMEEALRLIDRVLSKSDKGDSMPITIKANVLMQKAFGSLNAQPSEESIAEAQQLFAETQGLYMKAIETEGNALEAMAQCAQLKSMLGQLDEALELTTCALSHARNREEIQELMQLMIYTRSQARAATSLSSATPDAAR